MFNKLKNYFKSKDYTVIDSYFAEGFDIKIKENKEGEQLISIRTSTPNRLIEIAKDGTKITHVIYDANNGTQKIEVPVSVYEKIINGSSN